MKSSEGATVTAFSGRVVSRRRQDTEFLPAALEIIETPASPLGRLIGATIIAFLCGALAWSLLGKVDISATAQGRIIPVGKSKVIQPFETGVVREIKVVDGESVAAGDVLVELDPTADASDGKRLQVANMQDQLDILRLRALIAGDATFVAPQDVDGPMAAVARSEMEAQVAERGAKIDGVDRQRAQKQAESREIDAAIAKIDASLPLISEQRDIRSALLGNQYGSRLAYLQVLQQVVEAQHDLDVQRHKREETIEMLAALDRQRAQFVAEFRKDWLTDLAKAEVLASEHREEIAKSAMRRGLRTLRAPVDGTVQQLAVHTLGGIVTPAEELMVIVPRGTGLEIEATLANRDVGFVHKGQPVEIKVETFNFTRYGLLHGTVESVSQDAIVPESDGERRGSSGRSEEGSFDKDRQPGQPSYVAHIALPAKGIETEQGFTNLEPGMAVTAEIATGRRTIIDFLLSSLQRMKSESFHER